MKEPLNFQQKEQSLTKSILRTLQILDQFAVSDELGIKDLSINTGLPASTVQRIVNTLESKNYLKQNPDTHKYRLGMAFFNISSRYTNSHDWVEIAKGHMEKVVETHKETVNLAILQGYNVAYLAKIESPHILRPNFPVGVPFPAACTSLGRAMLAFQKNINLEEMISKIENPTERTITDPEQMAKELEKVRNNGYAMEDEEFHPGLFCIGAPIKDGSGRVIAAVSISIPKTRLDITMLPTLVNDMVTTANNISADVKNFFQFDGEDNLRISTVNE